jgi:hypothetical protein
MRSQLDIEEIFRKMNLETDEQRSKFAPPVKGDVEGQTQKEVQFIRIQATTTSETDLQSA